MEKIRNLLKKVFIGCLFIQASYTVNAQTACDYNSSSVTFNIGVPASLPPNSLTIYLLVDDATNLIAQISATPSFSGIVQTKVYDVYAYSYVNDNTVTGLTVGGSLSAVTASCGDFSSPLTVRICPPPIGGGGACDYTTSSFTLQTQTPPPAGGTTRYILTNLSGTILQVSPSPSFSGLSGSQSYNVYAVSYTGSISNLTVGGNYNNISGICYDLSNPVLVTVCVCKPICLPVTIARIK